MVEQGRIGLQGAGGGVEKLRIEDPSPPEA